MCFNCILSSFSRGKNVSLRELELSAFIFFTIIKLLCTTTKNIEKKKIVFVE